MRSEPSSLKRYYRPFEHARCRFLAVVCLLAIGAKPAAAQSKAKLARQPLVQAVAAVGVAVPDEDRSAAFYSQVLSFEKASDTEVDGTDYQDLEAVPGARASVV